MNIKLRHQRIRSRYEPFGGIIYDPKIPAQIYVDRAYMRSIGYPESLLWKSDQHWLSAPCEVHFAITNKCPFTCPHCYTNSSSELSEELSTNEIKKTLSTLSEMKVFQVAFEGGEPFARPDIFDLAEETRRLGMTPNITTNGFYITDSDFALRCRIFGQLNLSLDSVKDIIRDSLSLETVKNAVGHLMRARIRPGINTVLSAGNFDQLEELACEISAWGLADMLLLRYKPSGRGGDNFNRLKLTERHLGELYPLLLRLRKKYGIRFRVDCSLFPAFAYHNLNPEELAFWGVEGCDAGNNLISIDPKGVFRACSFCFDDAGLISKVADVWADHNHLIKFRDWMGQAPEPCSFCRYLSICKGGCHPIAVFEGKGFYAPDPACPIAAGQEMGECHKALLAL